MTENQKNTIPPLVGIKEVAAIIGWDQRKLSLYLKRGKFLEPFQRVAATPLWIRSDIERYAKTLHNTSTKNHE